MKWIGSSFAVVALLSEVAVPAQPDHATDVEAWHKGRIERLTAPEGWLTLIGLFWLKEGDNRVGSAADNDIVLPKGPAFVGTLTMRGDDVELRVAPGVTVTHEGKPVTTLELESDDAGAPTKLAVESLIFHLITRGGRLAVRLRDQESAARREFRGIERYPLSAAHRVPARFEAYDPAKMIQVPNIQGAIESTPSPGALVFELDGKTLRLDAVEQGKDELFIIFADKTNARETYGAGRFVYVPKPRSGATVIDFNKAFNPPCAFTSFATCPLPPPQNRLPIEVKAGEKKAGH